MVSSDILQKKNQKKNQQLFIKSLLHEVLAWCGLESKLCIELDILVFAL